MNERLYSMLSGTVVVFFFPFITTAFNDSVINLILLSSPDRVRSSYINVTMTDEWLICAHTVSYTWYYNRCSSNTSATNFPLSFTPSRPASILAGFCKWNGMLKAPHAKLRHVFALYFRNLYIINIMR